MTCAVAKTSVVREPKLWRDGGPIWPETLRGPGFFYVGSPYSKYPDGLEAAFIEISKITGWLIRQGIGAYSPIAHTHPVAIHSGMDPLDHTIWLEADRYMMDAARGLIVAEMETWQQSYGLNHEIDVFVKADKPIVHLLP